MEILNEKNDVMCTEKNISEIETGRWQIRQRFQYGLL